MESYMIMLYVTIEQEIELKKFFMNRGWPYCKTDLSMMTDHIGPLTGQVPHLTRQTLGLGPSLSPQDTQLLEAARKRAAEGEIEMPPLKKQVTEPAVVSSPLATSSSPLVTSEAAKAAVAAAPVPVAPTNGGDVVSQQQQGQAGSTPQRLSQEKEIVLDQEPVKVKTEPYTEVKTYSKIQQKQAATPGDDKSTPAKVQAKPISPSKLGTPVLSKAVTVKVVQPGSAAEVKLIKTPSTAATPSAKQGTVTENQKTSEGTPVHPSVSFYQKKPRETTVETIIVPCPGPVVNPHPTDRSAGMQHYMKNISKSKLDAKKANMKVALKKGDKKLTPVKGKAKSPVKSNSKLTIRAQSAKQATVKKTAAQRAKSESPKKATNGKLKTFKVKAVKKAAINPAKKYKMMQTRRQTQRPRRNITKKK